MSEGKWDDVLARLKIVHERDRDAVARLEALVAVLTLGGRFVPHIPRVSVGWLLYTLPGRSGEVTLGLARPDGYELSLEMGSSSWTRAVPLASVLVELDLALKVLAGSASPATPFCELKPTLLGTSVTDLRGCVPAAPVAEWGDPSEADLAGVFAGAPSEG